jgi:hypothetical protein
VEVVEVEEAEEAEDGERASGEWRKHLPAAP